MANQNQSQWYDQDTIRAQMVHFRTAYIYM